MAGSKYTFNGGTAPGASSTSWTLASGPGNASGLPEAGDIAVVAGGKVQYATAMILPALTLQISDGIIALCNPSNDGTQSGMSGGTTVIATGGSIVEYGSATNPGLIDATANTFTLLLHQEGMVTAEADILNTGTIEATNGGTLDIANMPSAELINSGLVLANGGIVDVTATLAPATGTWQVGDGGSMIIDTAVATGAAFTFAGSGTLDLEQPGGFAAAITGFAVGDTITLGPDVSADAALWSAGTLTVTNGGTTVDTLALPGDFASSQFAVNTVGGEAAITIVCFAAGTRIATDNRAVAIEDLRVGDRVRTSGNAMQPIEWIGRRTVNCMRHPQPRNVWPIRIRAGAFGPDVPQRDLFVSPQHAIFVEGVLIPAKYLVNGSTVTQEPRRRITYFHIELPKHDIVFAEGLTTESYLDTGNRWSFENTGGLLVLHPDFSRWTWDARAFAELKVVGPELDRVRALLQSRADKVYFARQHPVQK